MAIPSSLWLPPLALAIAFGPASAQTAPAPPGPGIEQLSAGHAASAPVDQIGTPAAAPAMATQITIRTGNLALPLVPPNRTDRCERTPDADDCANGIEAAPAPPAPSPEEVLLMAPGQQQRQASAQPAGSRADADVLARKLGSGAFQGDDGALAVGAGFQGQAAAPPPGGN
jgi:hypothetical protein